MNGRLFKEPTGEKAIIEKIKLLVRERCQCEEK